MFRLVFACVMVLYLWLGSFIPDSSHRIAGNHHEFVYSWGAKAHGLASIGVFAGAAVFLWRVKKDKVAAFIMIAVIPLIGIGVWPQLFMERVEVTPTTLVYRREPPHTKYNADLAWNQMQNILEERIESGSFGTYLRSRYHVTMQDGRRVNLPTSEMLTAGREWIQQFAADRKIPYEISMVPR